MDLFVYKGYLREEYCDEWQAPLAPGQWSASYWYARLVWAPACGAPMPMGGLDRHALAQRRATSGVTGAGASR